MTEETGRKPVVAIPRALWYHLHPGLWTAFFAGLGCDVILSGETSRATVECAALISESEHCLPVKLHDAHLHEIAGRCETVFIPRILSTLPGHIACPKLSALPDCAIAQFGDKTEILTVDIDERRRPLLGSLLRLGRSMGVPRLRVRRAARAALEEMRKIQDRLRSTGRPAGEFFFLVLGHPYNLFDPYMAGPILSKLDAMGVKHRLVDYTRKDIEQELIKWDSCSIMYETIGKLAPDRCLGVIQLSSFNCGCDSVVIELFRALLKKKKIPYMTLVLDENEALAGIDTRLEAFVDSIGWKNAQVS